MRSRGHQLFLIRVNYRETSPPKMLSRPIPDTKEHIMTQATQKLVTDLRVLAADAEELVKATASQTGDKITEVRGKIQQSVADLKPRLAQAQAALTDNAKAAVNTGDAYVHSNPWTAMGVAAGVGLLVGLLIGRR
jgi:ElaB/YqjD/DUF883 family membrane-anchored ribosome-binding protein